VKRTLERELKELETTKGEGIAPMVLSLQFSCECVLYGDCGGEVIFISGLL